MRHRLLASASAVAVVVAVVSLSAIPVAAQTAPRTAWGQPDLQGIWDFRTITPLQRPEELGDKEFLTEEEAANLEQEAVDRDIRLWNRSAQRTTAGGNVDRRADGTPGFYNNFWLDRGTNIVGTRRTSLIVDPPDGKIPALTPEGQKRADARTEARRRPAASWEDRSLFERCVTRPLPRLPGGYNQNLQILQTPW